MLKPHGFLLLIVNLLLLSACAQTKFHIPISSNIHENIDKTDINIGIAQKNIYMKIHGARNLIVGSPEFGFLDALIGSVIQSSINSSRVESAENALRSISNDLNDIKFGEKFSSAINVEMKSLVWLKATNADVVNSFKDDMTQSIVDKNKSSAILIIKPNYYMSADARSFNLDTEVTLYPTTPSLIKISEKDRSDDNGDNVIYRNQLRFTYFLPPELSTSGSKGLILHIWAENNSKQIKVAIRTGILETSKMLALDLSEIISRNKMKQHANLANIDMTIKSKGEYELIRKKDGSLLTLYN